MESSLLVALGSTTVMKEGVGQKNRPFVAQRYDLLYLPSFIYIAHYGIDALIVQPAIFDYPISGHYTKRQKSYVKLVWVRLIRFPTAKFPKTLAGSTGRCNIGLEFTCWSLKA